MSHNPNLTTVPSNGLPNHSSPVPLQFSGIFLQNRHHGPVPRAVSIIALIIEFFPVAACSHKEL
jgi:hypothetical protein